VSDRSISSESRTAVIPEQILGLIGLVTSPVFSSVATY
jgi:hypothetical protein